MTRAGNTFLSGARIAAAVVALVVVCGASWSEAAPPNGLPMRIEGVMSLDGYQGVPMVLEWDDGAGGYYDPTTMLVLVETSPPGFFDNGFGGTADWSVNRFSTYYNGVGS